MQGKCACPVCGYLTLPERGHFDICQVCFWEDDGDRLGKEADYENWGPNGPSLNQARINFKEFGASERQFLKNVRKPFPIEIPSRFNTGG